MTLLPQWMKGLTPEMISRAEVELGETPESKRKCLQELRQLIDEEPGFCPVMEDSFLLRFLRAKKYNVKKTFKTLKNYYEFKNSYSGTITDLKPSQLKRILEMDKVFITPKRDQNGGGIMILFVGKFDLEKATPYDLFAASFLCADIGIDADASQVCGSSIIFDFQGISLSKLKHYSSPTLISLMVTGIQDRWPFRMNAFHIVNEPSYFSMTYNIVKPMLSKKLKDRVHFHGDNLASLHSFIPPESLPKELGGLLPPEAFDEYRSLILSQESFVEKLNKYVYHGSPSSQYKPRTNRDKEILEEVHL